MARQKIASGEKGFVKGEVVMRPLSSVKPNKWNPNRMTAEQMESVAHGFRTDGWLVSQSLLIWGKDDTGAEHNVIIDGEHRFTVAKKVGIKEGPMVFLDGLTEAQAKALTIKMNQKRGDFDSASLAELITELSEGYDDDSMAIDLGFGQAEIDSMLGGDENTAAAESAMGVNLPPPPPPLPKAPPGVVGVQPKMKLPLVFYVDNTELEWFKAPFVNPDRPTELRVDVLRTMIQKYQP